MDAHESWKLTVMWVVATAVATTTGFIAWNYYDGWLRFQPLVFSSTGVLQQHSWLETMFLGPSFIGLSLGIAQSVVLFSLGKRALLWIPVSMIGVGFGFAFGFTVADLLPTVTLYRLTLYSIVGGLTGFLQWLLVRHDTVRTFRWIPVSIVGWLLFFGTAQVTSSVIETEQLVQVFNMGLSRTELVSWALGGAVLGVITGSFIRSALFPYELSEPEFVVGNGRLLTQIRTQTVNNTAQNEDTHGGENYHKWLGSDINNRR